MTDKNNKSYQQLSDELTAILEWFESGDVDIDSALAKNEQASALITQLEDYLKTAENKIKKITSQS